MQINPISKSIQTPAEKQIQIRILLTSIEMEATPTSGVRRCAAAAGGGRGERAWDCPPIRAARRGDALLPRRRFGSGVGALPVQLRAHPGPRPAASIPHPARHLAALTPTARASCRWRERDHDSRAGGEVGGNRTPRNKCGEDRLWAHRQRVRERRRWLAGERAGSGAVGRKRKETDEVWKGAQPLAVSCRELCLRLLRLSSAPVTWPWGPEMQDPHDSEIYGWVWTTWETVPCCWGMYPCRWRWARELERRWDGRGSVWIRVWKWGKRGVKSCDDCCFFMSPFRSGIWFNQFKLIWKDLVLMIPWRGNGSNIL